jgi:hypothetical protein
MQREPDFGMESWPTWLFLWRGSAGGISEPVCGTAILILAAAVTHVEEHAAIDSDPSRTTVTMHGKQHRPCTTDGGIYNQRQPSACGSGLRSKL